MVLLFKRLLYFIKRKTRLLFGLRRVHFIGDSHADVFWDMEFSPLYFWKIIPKIKVVHGATATGLSNPNSKTKAVTIFEEYLKNEVNKEDYVVFQLGEVDCGFAIWYRAEKHNISVQEQRMLAVSNYTALIEKSSAINGNKTVVCSAVLPTIQDNKNFGEVANLRKEVKASILERTGLTLSFNASLKEYTKIHSLGYIDLDKHILNKETKILHSKFLHKDPANHHLNPKHLSKILDEELGVIFS
jgi:hypothetical protein